MKKRIIFVVSAACLGTALFSGCKATLHKVDVALMTPIPLTHTSAANADALEKMKEAKIAPDAVSQNSSEQYLTSREVQVKGKFSSEGASASEENSGSTAPSFSDPVRLFTKPPVLNSRYEISNLADLYEWRIANELRFKFEDIFSDNFELYYIPAVISIMPDKDTFENYYVRVTCTATCDYAVTSDRSNGQGTRAAKLGGANDWEIWLLAIAPFRQFDSRAESLAKREQFLLTVAAAGAAKTGGGNVNLEGYYKLMKQWEQDFSQIQKVPVMTSFIENGRNTFGWNIYPSFVIGSGGVKQQMINDSWRVSAIIAVKPPQSRTNITVAITIKSEWLPLPDSGKDKRLDGGTVTNTELVICRELEIHSATVVSKRIIKLAGIGMKDLKSVKITSGNVTNDIVLSSSGADDVPPALKINSETVAWLVLDRDLEKGNGYLLEAMSTSGSSRTNSYLFFNYKDDKDNGSSGAQTGKVANVNIDLKVSGSQKN